MSDTESERAEGSSSGGEALRRALMALKDLRARAEQAERAATEPIAIIGMGCRFPAGANSPAEYWELLRAGRDGVGPVPVGRWNDVDVDGDRHFEGAFIDQRVDMFDAPFFGIAPVEANYMDPQQRLLLEVSWEALENAGVAPDSLAGTSTGVFVGLSTSDYSHLVLRRTDPNETGTYSGTGVAPSVAAGRLSFVLGLRGPSMCLDTACSSSLVSIAMATQSLRSGACRMALAGGVNLMLDSQTMTSLNKLQVLSPSGRCHTFAAAADGYARGEGAGMVVLKRLSDAEADGDRVLAVIRAAAVNHDGRSSGLTVPSGPAQREVIEQALTESGLAPADIDVIEAHGTGTPLGDPIEVRALDAVYSRGRSPEHPLLIGSAKTNVGHLEAAAGIAGLMKIVLALQHDQLPPHLNCDRLSPHIDWASMPVEVNRELRPWARGGRVRRAAVSGFGWSGTNAHVILEEAPRPAPPTPEPASVLLPLSARDDAALSALAADTADALKSGVSAADLAWTLQRGRGRFRRRMAITVGDVAGAAEQLRSLDLTARTTGISVGTPSANRPRLAFVFTGQGAQLPGMGRDLYEHEPVFRKVIDDCDAALAPYLPHRLLDVLYGDELSGLIHQTQYTQPTMFALQCAITQMWRSWGVAPDLVVGHSIGEYAAAVSAGVMDIDTAAGMIAARGSLMGALPSGGRMEALFADESIVGPLIARHTDLVSIAAVNGPTSVVISGDGEAIDGILAELDSAKIQHRSLEVSHAFHSPLMRPMIDEFGDRIGGAELAEPAIPFVSTVTGVAEKATLTSHAYWRDQISATVRFGDAIQSIVASRVEHFVEIGPQPTLLGLIARIRGGNDGLHASLRPASGGRPGREQMLDALGELWTVGVEPDWVAVDGGARTTIDAPTYPFQRQRFWINESRRRNAPAGGHPLLGVSTPVPALGAILHEAAIAVDSPAWLDDHRLAGTPVFPGAAYLEMVLAAVETGAVVESLQIRAALVLSADAGVTVQTVVTGSDDRQQVQVTSLDPTNASTHGGTVHATATVVRPDVGLAAPAPLELAAEIDRFAFEEDVADYYERLHDAGLTYGPTFRGVTRLFRGTGRALGEIRLPGGADTHRYRLHPAVLDACFHVLGAAIEQSDTVPDMFVPVDIDRVRLLAPGATHVWALVTLDQQPAAGAASIAAEIRIYDTTGQPVAVIERLTARRTPRAAWERAIGATSSADDLYGITWRPEPRAPLAAGDRAVAAWVVVCEDDATAGAVSAELGESGVETVEVVTGFDVDRVDASIDRLARAADGRPIGVVGLLGDPRLPGADVDSRAAVELGLRPALELARSLGARPAADARLWLVTRGAQSTEGEAVDVAAAAVWGLGRSVAHEQRSLACVCIDLDPAGGDDSWAELALELIAGGSADRPSDDQVALRGRRRLVARLERCGGEPVLQPPYGLTLDGRGSLEQMSYAPIERRQPGPGEIEVEVRASGLNFRDVLNVLGMYPGDPGLPGLECAGVVTAIGLGVSGRAVGDEVLGIAPQAYDSHVVTLDELMVTKPTSITFAEAATLPIAFLTAAYGLSELAGLRPGQSVLIHAAAGGVGMAAVRIAQRIGAEVFATVGSAEKRRTVEALGVRHVYNSRTLDFADQILADTQGRGVDVVLNALADDFITRSFDALADDGCFLEIGKRGVWTPEQAAAVRPQGRYFVYELADFLAADPAGVQRSLQSIVDDIVTGSLEPHPLRAFDAGDIHEAFRFMAQARHIGKVVVTHRPTADRIRRNGAYVITGGLGALGLEVARWLAREGAGHIILAGRSTPSPEAAATIEQLRTEDLIVTVVKADVSDADDVQRLLKTPLADGVVLRGVFHAAGVIDDGALSQQTWPRFETVLAPKMFAADLLDAATRRTDLDHFVLFSSVAAVMGSPGQVNYAAANSALDAIAHRRRAAGLPAVSINWGAWGEVGMAARLDERAARRVADRGMRMLATDQALDALGRVLDSDIAQVTVMSVDWAAMLREVGGDVPPLLTELARARARTSIGSEVADADASSLVDALATAGADQHHGVTAEHVSDQIARVLGLPPGEALDRDQDLAELGMDSLMAVELSNRLRSSTGLELAWTIALEHPSIHALSAHLIDLLGLVVADAGSERDVGLITHALPGEVVMATSAQERLLFIERLSPGTAIYNIPLVLRLTGPLDDTSLELAVTDLVRRHEPLRTDFSPVDDKHHQVVVDSDAVVVPFTRHDGRALDQDAVEALLQAQIAQPFDLADGPNIRSMLIRTADDVHLLAITMHHVATDGWSVTRVLRDLLEFFNARTARRPPALEPLTARFADYAAWQHEVERSAAHNEKLRYWTGALAGTLPVLDLPSDRPRPTVASHRSGTVMFELTADEWAALRAASRDAGVTPFVFLLTSYVATLSRWSGQDDIIVGTATANRSRPEFQDVVGMFVNTIALRLAIDTDAAFASLLDHVKATTLRGFAHDDVPFDRVVEAINPPRDLSRTIIYQTTFMMINVPMPHVEVGGGVGVDVMDATPGAVEHDLAVRITESEGRAKGTIEFNADVFDVSTVERLVNHWRHLMASAVTDPASPVGRLAMIPTAELELIDQWSAGRSNPPAGGDRLEAVVAARAAASPSATAVRCGSDSLSYAALMERSLRLSRMLADAGVEPGDRVGVAVDRSVEMLVALLGVLGAGAAYVPLDPEFPDDRLAFMIADAGVEVAVVTGPTLSDQVDTSDLRLVDLIAEAELIDSFAATPDTRVGSGWDDGEVAYVIYTSGSTGQPKGVEVTHASAVNFVRSMLEEPGFSPDDVLLAVTTLSFDISVLELFVPLAAGGQVVIAGRHDVVDGRRLAALLTASKATVMQATPTTWSMLLDAGWRGASELTVLCGGEAMPVDLGRQLHASCGAVWNMFGPTETTIWSTVQRLDESVLSRAAVPIGRPILNTVCRVLTSSGEVAPVGVPGELFIGGLGVAKGYLNRAELTDERFVVDPIDPDRVGRLYRTGDLVRWLPDGSLGFLGRVDFQVKVRGHRIELGEIESALRAHPAVRDAVAVAHGSAGEGQLVAYPIFDPSLSYPSVPELRAFLQQWLPDYMVPSRFVHVDAFPLTPNRKIDRNALPRADVFVDGRAPHREPSTTTEQLLAGIWTDLLEVPAVSLDDNFFDLGGHSVLAMRVASRVMAGWGVDIELRSIFEARTLAHLAVEIDARSERFLEIQPIPLLDRRQRLPLSFAQERMWFLDKLATDHAVYAIPMVARVRGPLDLGALSWCVDRLVARHESLRSRILTDDDGALYTVIDPPPIGVLSVIDLRQQANGYEQALADIEVMIHKSVDFAAGGVFRATAFVMANDDHVLCIVVHHIAADGWSTSLISNELGELYSARIAGREPVLRDLGPQFVDFAAWQREKVQGPDLLRQLAYWREHLDGMTPVQLPTDRLRPPLDTQAGGALDWPVSSQLMARLTSAAREEGVSQFAYLLASFEAVLLRYGDQDDVAVGVPLAYRRRVDLEPIVGDFVNLLVIRATPDADMSFRDLVHHVSDALHGAHSHPDMPFDNLVADMARERDFSRAPLVQVMFNVHQPPRAAQGLPGFDVEPIMIDRGAAQFDLSVVVVATEELIDPFVRMEFKSELFDLDTIERLVAQWQVLLDGALTQPSTPWRSLPVLPSDELSQLARWSTSALDALAGTSLEEQRVERLIGATCAQRADQVAIRFGSNSLTYDDLARRSDRLADVLRASGVLRGDRVGVAVQRSHTMVETLLAVWKVGAAYVPLDPSFPSDRLSFMIKDAGLRVVLTSGESLPDDVDLNGAEPVDVIVAVHDDVAPAAAVEGLDGSDVAYVIYTSGSTGLPKGVEIEHRAAVNFLLSMRDEPGLNPDDVLLAVTTLSFDISVLELFLPLVVGAQVVIADRDDAMDGQRLAQLIRGSGATVMQATPTTWTMLFELGWTGASGLRVLCGGEAMPPELASRLVETCGEVWNMFGPTETTVWSTVFRVTAAFAERRQIPIGHPIASTVCRVLDRDGQPVPIGIPGELMIGGAGLARGYLNRPELTAERFVADPLAPGARLYRTGDLVRWRPDGTIDYLGRLDHQVKIRGFRIELGEIESALRAHAGVNDAVVIADGSAASARLLAYVIPVDVESPLPVVELRTWLQQRLPEYMVPSRYMKLEEFPLTPNRKINRNALPRPSDSDRLTDRAYVAPRNDVEAVIATVFATTLKLEQVSVDDDFFELGGHSLQATSVLSKLHAMFGVESDLRKFFLEPTVAHAAEVLTEDPEARSRVERVAMIRQRLDSMSPEEVRATLAARSSPGDEVRDGG